MTYLLKKMRISLFLLLLPIYSFAIIPSDSISSPTVVTTLTNDDVCNLPGPSGLYVTGTTNTSISAAWASVAGSNGYYVVATVIGTGTIYGGAGVTFATNATIIASSGATVKIDVFSRCGLELGGFSSIVGQVDLIILQDLVVGFQGSPIDVFDCENFEFDGNIHKFQAKHNNNALGIFKNFRVMTKALVPSSINAVEVGYVHIDAGSPIDIGQGGGGTWRFTSDKPGQPFPQGGGSVTAKKLVTIRHALSGTSFVEALQLEISLTNTGYQVCKIIPQGSNYNILRFPSDGLRTDPNPTSFAQLSPNPFTEALTLYLEDPAPERSILRIFDLSGREVLKQDIEPFVTSATVDFESTLQPGIYLARFESPEGVHMLKIIKTE